jgi:hypothetical protein
MTLNGWRNKRPIKATELRRYPFQHLVIAATYEIKDTSHLLPHLFSIEGQLPSLYLTFLSSLFKSDPSSMLSFFKDK